MAPALMKLANVLYPGLVWLLQYVFTGPTVLDG